MGRILKTATLIVALAACGGETKADAGGASPTGGMGGAPGAGGTGGAGAASTGGMGGSAGGADGGGGAGGTPMSTGYSIRFFGNGGIDDDRVKWRIDDPSNDDPGGVLDIGAEDFTLDFWMKANAVDNPNPALSCGADNSWTASNIIIDRDRHSQPRSYGVGVSGGVTVFNITGEFSAYTLCGTTNVLDETWHHISIARRRSDGFMWIFVDGNIDASIDGPDGDVSYPDDGVPQNVCPDGLCDYSDPFLVLGAEKHGYSEISYNGLVDELRISNVLGNTAAFDVPSAPYATDGNTVGLFHFDETAGTLATDSANHPSGANHGTLNVGGDPTGPVWTRDSPF